MDLRYTGLNAVTAPSSIVRPTGSTDEAQNSNTYAFTLGLIDGAVEAAKLASPVVRPIKIAGKNHWAMVLHPKQVTSLRTNTNAGQWLDIQKAAMQGGMIEDNPIATGMLGVYNGVMLYENTRVTQGVHSTTGAAISTVRRAVLLGAPVRRPVLRPGLRLHHLRRLERRAVRLREPARRRGRLHLRSEEDALQQRGPLHDRRFHLRRLTAGRIEDQSMPTPARKTHLPVTHQISRTITYADTASPLA